MEPFIGQIQAFGFSFAPRGWAKCDGSLLAINSHQALFSLLGTTYGGDGRTTFGLPDLRGRTMVHQGRGAGLSDAKMGQKGGHESVTLSLNNMPSHNHSVSLHGETAIAAFPGAEGRMLAQTPNNPIYADPVPADDKTMAAQSIREQSVGGGQSFDVRAPFEVVNVCIALEGIFPSRN